MEIDQDMLDRRINDFAKRSFRDMADMDYIAARLACKAELFPQMLWATLQAFEKYLKYVLLVNRIPAKKVKHKIRLARELTEKLSFKIELSGDSNEFFEHVATYGEYRYVDVSTFAHGPILFQLDKAVWELRRYCQVLDVRGKKLPDDEQQWLEEAILMLNASTVENPHAFRLANGFLEQVISKESNPAYEALTWNNAFFGVKPYKEMKFKSYLQMANSPLYLYPEMLDELTKYVFIPDKLQAGYREHLNEILADPTKRP